MTSARTLLSQYRSALRLIARCEKECVPLARIAGHDKTSRLLDARDSLRHNGAFLNAKGVQFLISRSEKQLNILLHAEDHTREAFQIWHGFLQRYKRAQLAPHTVCQAIEEAALALPDLASGEPPLLEDLQDPAEDEGSSGLSTSDSLDSLAQQVLHSAPPYLFVASGAASGGASTQAEDFAAQRLQLEHLHKVLVEELKFVERPFEWAYEGLAPLLLRDVVRQRRCISFSRALLASCIARRLGLCLVPVPISRTDTGQGHSIAGTPELSRWILRHDGAASADWPEPAYLQHTAAHGEAAQRAQSRWYWNPATRAVLSRNEALHSFPRLADNVGKEVLLQVWTEMLRVAFVAHQRRGDSDAVAHCLHQLLALDLADPGWDAILQNSS